jgi:hypothetical protein
MESIANHQIYTHLNEEMANALAKAKSEVHGGDPRTNGISITEEGVSMTPEAAFGELYIYDRVLWENVCDAFIDIAQAKFEEFHKVDPDSDDHDYHLNNGVGYQEDMIEVLR